MPFDILQDFAEFSYGKRTPLYNKFMADFPGIIKPDCPLTLNSLYATVRGGWDTDYHPLKKAINNSFLTIKNSLVGAIFVSGLLLLITFLWIMKVNLLLAIGIVVTFIVICLLAILFWNPKLTDILKSSARQSSGSASPSSLPSLADFTKYATLLEDYKITFIKVRDQASHAICK